MPHSRGVALLFGLILSPVAGFVATAADLPASNAKGRELLKEGDALADKNKGNEAILKYKAAFEQILPGMRRVPFKHEVKRDVTAREDMRAMLIKDMNEDTTPDQQDANEKALKALGLIPMSLNLKEVQLSVYAEEIAAFYDPKTKTMHLIKEPEKPEKKKGFLESLLGGGGGFNKEEQKTVIAHELTHALADQNFDLYPLMMSVKDNDDRSLALLSVIEGEATMTMFGVSMQDWDGKLMAALPGEDLDASLKMIGPLLNFAGGKSLRNAPPIIMESMIFPYFKGAVFCTSIVNRGGWEAIDKAYANPPISSEQVLHPAKYMSHGYDAPTHLQLGKLEVGSGWKELGRNVVGEMQISVMLRRNDGKKASEGWDGDRYAVYQGPGDRLGLVWLTTWDTEEDAREFIRSYVKFQTTKMEKGTPNPEVLTDSHRRPEADRIFAVERRGNDVAIVEGFGQGITEQLLESAFKAEKAEMNADWLKAEAAAKAKEKSKDKK